MARLAYAGAMTVMPADWLRPDWPAPPQVHALCTTRAGGVSARAWSGFNLGRLVADDPGAVALHWQRLAGVMAGAGAPVRPVYLRQVHGTRLQELEQDTPDTLEADASTTRVLRLACIAMAADCLPVLLCNASGTRVAAAHAGWRGLAGGVLESALSAFAGDDAGTLLAWLGPCIGAQAFEVGAEVRAAFCARDGAAARHFQPAPAQGKYLADLAALARQRLRAAGLTRLYGNDSGGAWCTVANPLRFFSYRRDQRDHGSSARMAAAIWLG